MKTSNQKKVIKAVFPTQKLWVIGSLIALLICWPSMAQQNGFKQYRGEVLDSDSQQPLVFATLGLVDYNISTVTNSEGEFLLKVPDSITSGEVQISFLGYQGRRITLEALSPEGNKFLLQIAVTQLGGIELNAPRDAETLVKETLRKRGDNYFIKPTIMTAFYRETIKKRRRNVSLSEAVATIYKAPYNSSRQDAVELFKARKSTDYSKLDTVALKLQGGPFNALFLDIMKYPDYIFDPEYIDKYRFRFERSTYVDERLIYVVTFEQKPSVYEPLYTGRLYIDAQNKILTSAVFTLNITNRELASQMFVRRKPANAEVYPTEIAYRVNYREKNGRWYYSYSNAMLEFTVDWDKKLFNSVYSMTSEMAITDWKINTEEFYPRIRNRVRSSIILSDEALGFSDPDFWGPLNIIEPEKSIESAIRKIQRQLRRVQRRDSKPLP